MTGSRLFGSIRPLQLVRYYALLHPYRAGIPYAVVKAIAIARVGVLITLRLLCPGGPFPHLLGYALSIPCRQPGVKGLAVC